MAAGKDAPLATTQAPNVTRPSVQGGADRWNPVRAIWPWVLLSAVLVGLNFASLAVNGTRVLSPSMLFGIAVLASQVLLLALGQTLVIISGGIDLSAGWILGLASVVAADVIQFMYGAGFGSVETTILSLLAGVGVAIVPGLVNGLVVTRVRIPAFAGTLAVGFVLEGVTFMRSSGYPLLDQSPYLGDRGGSPLFDWMSTQAADSSMLALPLPAAPILSLVLLTLVVTAICWFTLTKTRFGQHLYAVGNSLDTARRVGIAVDGTRIRAYLISALLAGMAGALWAARVAGVAYYGGETLEIMSIAAAVIGGATLMGGEGTIGGTVAGALVIATIQYGLIVLGARDWYVYFAVALVTVLTVIAGALGRKIGHAR